MALGVRRYEANTVGITGSKNSGILPTPCANAAGAFPNKFAFFRRFVRLIGRTAQGVGLGVLRIDGTKRAAYNREHHAQQMVAFIDVCDVVCRLHRGLRP